SSRHNSSAKHEVRNNESDLSRLNTSLENAAAEIRVGKQRCISLLSKAFFCASNSASSSRHTSEHSTKRQKPVYLTQRFCGLPSQRVISTGGTRRSRTLS